MSSEEKRAERLRERVWTKREVALMLAQGAVERSRMAGHAAPGRGREAAGGDTSSAATPGRRVGGGMRLGGAGTGAEAGNWAGGRRCIGGYSRSSGGWGIRPAVSQYDRGGGGEAQTTRDRYPRLRGFWRWIRRRRRRSAKSIGARTVARVPPPSPPGHTTSYKKN
ncbi:hypothetical protein B0H14DRAFT_2980906 [Mycena olivaceomarginata]|nr:hypothetical protein B0H14DRAFT_2980906 [Mycena olivaceomarginata]